MTKCHLLICGERGVGKSTLLRRLLAASTRPVGGFVTKRLTIADENGFYPIYIHPAAQPEAERSYLRENLVGICDSRSSVPHKEVFDTLGVRCLAAAPENGLVLMDELGFLENDALAFQKAVLRGLDGDAPVLAAIKPKDTEFLCRVREHPKAEVFWIDAQNRDALYASLLPRITAWNAEIK